MKRIEFGTARMCDAEVNGRVEAGMQYCEIQMASVSFFVGGDLGSIHSALSENEFEIIDMGDSEFGQYWMCQRDDMLFCCSYNPSPSPGCKKILLELDEEALEFFNSSNYLLWGSSRRYSINSLKLYMEIYGDVKWPFSEFIASCASKAYPLKQLNGQVTLGLDLELDKAAVKKLGITKLPIDLDSIDDSKFLKVIYPLKVLRNIWGTSKK